MMDDLAASYHCHERRNCPDELLHLFRPWGRAGNYWDVSTRWTVLLSWLQNDKTAHRVEQLRIHQQSTGCLRRGAKSQISGAAQPLTLRLQISVGPGDPTAL